MDPITAIAAAIYLIGAGLYYIAVALLTLSDIINWFRTRRSNSRIRATLKDRMANGQYKVIAVGLDRNYNVQESTGYRADDLDSDLYNAHYGEEVVIWT